MLQQIVDLKEEGDALHHTLLTLKDGDWDRPTLFKGWTVNDVLQHLHVGDQMAWTSATAPQDFDAFIGSMRARRAAGMTRVEETRDRLGGLTGRALLTAWHDLLGGLCAELSKRQIDERLKWAGPAMSLRMFTTARQMEIWAHGQEIYDLLGHTRVPAARLRNIAEIGVRTFGWTFSNRGLPPPGPVPYVRLHAPDGTDWEWNEPSDESAVTGEAVAFCQVVTQVRNVADTKLVVRGDVARSWMSIAQCFAARPRIRQRRARGSRHGEDRDGSPPGARAFRPGAPGDRQRAGGESPLR